MPGPPSGAGGWDSRAGGRRGHRAERAGGHAGPEAVRHSRCRPGRPWGPIPAAVGLVLGWWLVAHSSGQGWVQALGDVVSAGVLIGLIGPWVILRRVRISLGDIPADGTAGVPLEITIRRSG